MDIQFTTKFFGEADCDTVGVVIDGVPVGLSLEDAEIAAALQRAGAEQPSYKIISGIHKGQTNGLPLCAVFPSAGAPQSADLVSENVLRPGFADIGEFKRSNGKIVLRNGGHTAEATAMPLVFAGVIAKLILKEEGIAIISHIAAVGEVNDTPFAEMTTDAIKSLATSPFPICDKRKEMLMKLKIAQTEKDQNSVGGKIECAVLGVPAGVGQSVANGLDSKLAARLFALPRCKAVEFGSGVQSGEMSGSEYNDLPYVDTLTGSVATKTNHDGGICGGESNGMPILFRAAFAPSPVIGKPQTTAHRTDRRDTMLPPFVSPVTCDIVRLAVLTESAAAITLAAEI